MGPYRTSCHTHVPTHFLSLSCSRLLPSRPPNPTHYWPSLHLPPLPGLGCCSCLISGKATPSSQNLQPTPVPVLSPWAQLLVYTPGLLLHHPLLPHPAPSWCLPLHSTDWVRTVCPSPAFAPRPLSPCVSPLSARELSSKDCKVQFPPTKGPKAIFC